MNALIEKIDRWYGYDNPVRLKKEILFIIAIIAIITTFAVLGQVFDWPTSL